MKRLFVLIVITALTLAVYTQPPQRMSYQCVVRNYSGALVTNQAVGMKISILQGSATGTVIFSETYSPNPQTNANGLLTVEIGSGTASVGTFAGINWGAGPYFLKTETDPSGGSVYTITGTSQLLSVPYALYAKTAANGFSGAWTDLTDKPSFAIVSTTGSYNDLLNKPALFDGTWTSLTGKPVLFDGTWTSLTGKPAFATVATTGLFADLLSKPTTLAGYGITDADNSITNEIQTLSLLGSALSLSLGGGTVTLPSTAGGDDWGTQTVVTDATLAGNGTTTTPLKIADNGVTAVKIATGAVLSDKLANGSVTGAKIAQAGATSNQALKWNGTTWVPSDDQRGFDLPYSGFISANVGFLIINDKGFAIEGKVTSATNTGTGTGVLGESTMSDGRGVWGSATATTGTSYGLYGESKADNGFGLKALASSLTGSNYGVWATSHSSSGYGIIGENNSTSGTTYGVRGMVSSSSGYSGYFTGGKFYISGNVGIGTMTPSRILTVHGGTGVSSVNFVNNASGNTSTDGLFVGLAGTLVGSVMNYENAALILGNNNIPRLTIQTNGSVGIGTLVPSYFLDVTGPINLNKGIASGQALMCNGSEAIWYNGTYFSWGYGGIYNYFKDAVGIDCAPGDGHMLAVNGVASKPGGGTWAAFSDSRLKDIHGPYTRGLAEIIKLQPVMFNYKNGNELNLPSQPEYVGFIAQEIEKVFPETITHTPSGYLEFDMHGVNVALVNAIKELKTENDELKDRLEKIETLIREKAGNL